MKIANITNRKIYAHSLALFFVTVPFVSLAVTGGVGNFVPCTGPGGTACDANKLLEMVNSVINFVVFRLVPIFATFAILLAGIRMVMNPDSAKVKTEGKKLIETVVVGMVIIFASYLIVKAIIDNLASSNTVGQALKNAFK